MEQLDGSQESVEEPLMNIEEKPLEIDMGERDSDDSFGSTLLTPHAIDGGSTKPKLPRTMS